MELALGADVVRLSSLAPRVGLPIDEQLAPLFPDGGLLPGSVVGCAGPAALSLAIVLAARAVAVGSWLAVVGVADLGVEAAIELGLPAGRLVSVDAGNSSLDWSERIAACADGFDLIITTPPARADRMVRRLRQRLAARGAVLIMVSDTDDAAVGDDVKLSSGGVHWIGIGHGHGALLSRTVEVTAVHRRRPRPISTQLWLPDAHRYRLVC